jgi:PPP family 3-phenylpropionic acid transporter
MPWVFFLSFVPFGAIFPYLVSELRGREVENIGLILALPAMMSIVAGPIWGVIADWTQNWSLILRISSICAAIGVVALGWVGPQWALVAMLFYAIGRAPITPISDALAVEAVADQPEEYGRLRLWGSIGYMAGVLGVGTLQYFFLGLSALWVGAFGTILFALMSFAIPAPKRVKRQDFSKALQLLFNNRGLMWLLLCSALHFSAHIANSNFLDSHVKSLGLDGLWVGMSMSAGIVVEIVLMSK